MCCTFKAKSFRALRGKIFLNFSTRNVTLCYGAIWRGHLLAPPEGFPPARGLRVVKVKHVQFRATGDVYVANALSS
jgi:hypothetical protein